MITTNQMLSDVGHWVNDEELDIIQNKLVEIHGYYSEIDIRNAVKGDCVQLLEYMKEIDGVSLTISSIIDRNNGAKNYFIAKVENILVKKDEYMQPEDGKKISGVAAEAKVKKESSDFKISKLFHENVADRAKNMLSQSKNLRFTMLEMIKFISDDKQ